MDNRWTSVQRACRAVDERVHKTGTVVPEVMGLRGRARRAVGGSDVGGFPQIEGAATATGEESA